MTNPLQPSPGLLCKLGSIAIHADELHSNDGHSFDKLALDTLLSDPEVIEWLSQMETLAMVPKKRNG